MTDSPKHHPPAQAVRFLRWFCPTNLHESIEGDLIEQFESDRRKKGRHADHYTFMILDHGDVQSHRQYPE